MNVKYFYNLDHIHLIEISNDIIIPNDLPVRTKFDAVIVAMDVFKHT
jgi:hypothetical protein